MFHRDRKEKQSFPPLLLLFCVHVCARCSAHGEKARFVIMPTLAEAMVKFLPHSPFLFPPSPRTTQLHPIVVIFQTGVASASVFTATRTGSGLRYWNGFAFFCIPLPQHTLLRFPKAYTASANWRSGAPECSTSGWWDESLKSAAQEIAFSALFSLCGAVQLFFHHC